MPLFHASVPNQQAIVSFPADIPFARFGRFHNADNQYPECTTVDSRP
jgi:hypothetical protein